MQSLRPVRPILALSLFLLIISSCHSHGSEKAPVVFSGVTDAEAAKYTGTYSGSFNKGIITLALNYISGKHVSGYNVHKGLRRNINGEVTRNGDKLDFVLKEPGDNPYDGIFYFSLDTGSLKIKGKWVPMDSSKIRSKQLALVRKVEDSTTEFSDYEWGTDGNDTTLNFHEDGTCILSFYQRPEDSTSQLITVRGNYVYKKDIYRIEWEKNTFWSANTMTLQFCRIYSDPSDSSSWSAVLRGNGLEFSIIGD